MPRTEEKAQPKEEFNLTKEIKKTQTPTGKRRAEPMFSLKKAYEIKEEEKETAEEDFTGMPADPFDPKDVLAFWDDFIADLKAKRDFVSHNVFKTLEIKVSEKGIVLQYDSESVLGQFEIYREKFMRSLREKFNNYHIKLTFTPSTAPVKNRIKTKKDLFDDLVKLNPEIGELGKDLGFDLYG